MVLWLCAMRIVCISVSEIPSSKANAIQVMKACQALAQVGHEVVLLAPKDDGRRATDNRLSDPPSPIELVQFYGLQATFPVEWMTAQPRWKRYDFCWQAVIRASQLRADAVYVWPLQSAVFAVLRGLPTLLELHGPPEGSLGPLLFRLFLSLPGKKRLLPITKALLGILAPKYSVLRVPISISPNGVEIERYQNLPSPPAARHALGLADNPTVGYTGHLYAGRGLNLLIELARRFREVQFVWVGGRPEEVTSWQSRLAADGITNITLTGFVENSILPRYQSACDVLLMPYERIIAGSSGGNSAAYCSPMKMFEYMACGRAIISSDLPVIHEVLNERNAVLCPPEEADAWATALQKLLDSPGQRQALARQALADVQQYSWIERARRALEGFCE